MTHPRDCIRSFFFLVSHAFYTKFLMMIIDACPSASQTTDRIPTGVYILLSDLIQQVKKSKMGEASDVGEQSERQALMVEDSTSNDQFIEEDELIFPWFLTETIKKSKEDFQSKPILGKHLLHSFYLQLLIVFYICIVDIVVGAVYEDHDYNARMVCIAFIVQGACGLFVVLVHTCEILFE